MVFHLTVKIKFFCVLNVTIFGGILYILVLFFVCVRPLGTLVTLVLYFTNICEMILYRSMKLLLNWDLLNIGFKLPVSSRTAVTWSQGYETKKQNVTVYILRWRMFSNLNTWNQVCHYRGFAHMLRRYHGSVY